MGKKELLQSSKMDPETEAALEVVAMERQREQNVINEQQRREDLIAQIYRIMGRIEAADFMAKTGDAASLMHLREVKENKLYKDVPGIGSWESFCNHIGMSRRTIDEKLQNLDIFGQEFLATVASFKIGYRELRKLRKSVSAGQILIEDNSVNIAGESIPLDPDHKEDLAAAIESLIEAKDQKIEETEAELKAQKRIGEEKNRVINKQEKDLAKYERQIKERDYKPGEENFIRDMYNIKMILTGLELKIDPEHIVLRREEDDKLTPLMISAYMETLEHFRRTAQAYYDTACDLIGIDGDEEWVQPGTEGSGS